MMCRIDSHANVKLPRWVAIIASIMGALMLGVGMSRYLRGVSMRETLLPMVVGSMMIYISGFEKRLSMDDEGVCNSKVFWGRKNEMITRWDSVTDARVILNKGKYMYVLLHSADKIPPFTLNRDQSDEVIQLLCRQLSEDRVTIER